MHCRINLNHWTYNRNWVKLWGQYQCTPLVSTLPVMRLGFGPGLGGYLMLVCQAASGLHLKTWGLGNSCIFMMVWLLCDPVCMEWFGWCLADLSLNLFNIINQQDRTIWQCISWNYMLCSTLNCPYMVILPIIWFSVCLCENWILSQYILILYHYLLVPSSVP